MILLRTFMRLPRPGDDADARERRELVDAWMVRMEGLMLSDASEVVELAHDCLFAIAAKHPELPMDEAFARVYGLVEEVATRDELLAQGAMARGRLRDIVAVMMEHTGLTQDQVARTMALRLRTAPWEGCSCPPPYGDHAKDAGKDRPQPHLSRCALSATSQRRTAVDPSHAVS